MGKKLIFGIIGISMMVFIMGSVKANIIDDIINFFKGAGITEEYQNPTGIEYNSTSNVYHLWNENDDYYIDADSGIQLTNHYEEYWSNNVWCVYLKLGTWRKYCANEFSWSWENSTDFSTYANLTGYTNVKEGAYEVDIYLEYYLDSDSNSIQIKPTLINEKKDFEGYLIWRIEDIRVDMTEENDRLTFDDYEYWLNESVDVSFSNLTYQYFYIWDGHEFLKLKWIEDNYSLNVANETGQYNAPIELWLGPFDIPGGTEYSTTFNWIDKPGSFNFEINVFETDGHSLICDGVVNSAGFDDNTVVYDLPDCELTMGTNYTIETLLTPVGDDWNLDYDDVSDHSNDGISSFGLDSSYSDSPDPGEEGRFCLEGLGGTNGCDTEKEIMIYRTKISNEGGTDNQDYSDIILDGDSGIHEYGTVWYGSGVCNPDGVSDGYTEVCIEFAEDSTYDLEANDVTSGEQDQNDPLNITFIASPDDDWDENDKMYMQYYIDAEGGDPEIGFMRFNWTIVSGIPPTTTTTTPDTCTYGGSGDWDVDCSDYCVKSSGSDSVDGSLVLTGTGSFTMLNYDIDCTSFPYIDPNCNLIMDTNSELVVAP